MATTLFRMTVPEVLQGVTQHAARALGQVGRHGSLAVGRAADFAVWQVETLAELAYWIGRPLCARVVRAGETVYTRCDSAS
jgi:imidazolonepropionase